MVLDHILPISSVLKVIKFTWLHQDVNGWLLALSRQRLQHLCCVRHKGVRMNHADSPLFACLNLQITLLSRAVACVKRLGTKGEVSTNAPHMSQNVHYLEKNDLSTLSA